MNNFNSPTSVLPNLKVVNTPTNKNRFRNAAIAYAEKGLYVTPLHEVLLDEDGKSTGCSCEEYYRSEKYKEKYPDRYDPEYSCPEKRRGKHPRLADWEEKASNDPAQIKKWWSGDWLFSNIGLAVGKSNLIMIDKDSYKDCFDGDDFLTREEENTVTVKSGGGGEHLYFCVKDKKFGNARWTFPEGVDVRGNGGLAVLPVSMHWSGKEYQFEEGFSFSDREPAELPERLFKLLTEANAKSKANTPVTLSDTCYPKPDLDKWRLSSRIVRLIFEGQSSADRSETDQAVLCGLVRAGLDDEQILAVFQNFPIGTQGKYAEDGTHYLAQSIMKAREYIASSGLPDGVSWPYAIRNDKTVVISETKDAETGAKSDNETVIFPYTAKIIEEQRDDEGKAFYTIAGTSPDRGNFSFEIPALEFAVSRELKAKLETAAYTPVNVGMQKHLINAIKKLSLTPQVTQRVLSTGWRGGKFVIPGNVPEKTRLVLDTSLPYELSPDADLDKGVSALESLMKSLQPDHAAIILASILAPVLATPMGWQNFRHGLVITGETGSLKTTKTSLFMSIYGSEFVNNSRLQRWGAIGTTVNRMMNLATSAGNLPFLIDNYKPNVKPGPQGLIELVQALMEGSEKGRMIDGQKAQFQRSIQCWPVVTGEDVPEFEAATLARLLTVRIPPADVDTHLLAAQENAVHLNAVGAAWIQWIESGAADQTMNDAKQRFNEVRSQWMVKLRASCADVANANRMATTLTVNQLTLEIAVSHPALAGLVAGYRTQQLGGLSVLAATMAGKTADAVEARRFLAALQELIATKRAVLIEGRKNDVIHELSRQTIGFRDDKGIYLFPTIARQAVETLISLENVSSTKIYDQLSQMKLLIKNSDGKSTKPVKFGNSLEKTDRMLHLSPDAFAVDDESVEL